MSNDTVQQFHFFGSTAFNWAIGSTRQEVLTKLASMAGADIVKRNVKNAGGLYAWTCKVEAPRSTTYEISFYQPAGVPTSDGMEFSIQNKHGHVKLVEKQA